MTHAIQRIRDYEKEQEDLATKKTTEGKVEALRRSLLSEEEVLLESLNSQQQLIDNAAALTIINEQQAADMKLAIEADYQRQEECTSQRRNR